MTLVGPGVLVRPHGLDEGGRIVAGGETGVRQRPEVKGNSGLDPPDIVLTQRSFHAGDGLLPLLGPHDQLGDHGIVVDRHLVTRAEPAVQPYAGSPGLAQARDHADRGHELRIGVFGGDAAFQGRAGQPHVFLPEGQGHARGDFDLPPDQVLARSQFRDRVLYLEAGVHLEEIEPPVPVHDELHGTGVGIPHGLGGPDGRQAHGVSHLIIEYAGRGFLDEFLMAALDRTFPLAEVNHVPVLVGEHLELHVTGLHHVLLQVDRGIPEGGLGLGPRGTKGGCQVAGRIHDAHALAAAAHGRLDEDRVADGFRHVEPFLVAFDPFFGPGDDRHAGPAHGLPRRGLASHGPHGFAGRTDERDPRIGAAIGEIRVFGQEPVTGVYGVGPGLPGRVDDPVHAEITVRGRRVADAVRLVGELDVQGGAVRFREHGRRFNAHLPARADHPDGDLAAVCDQDFPEHVSSYSGMFPCFLGGLASRLFFSISSADMMRGRVSRGWITSSIYPIFAAM